jgi:hypothetical protein
MLSAPLRKDCIESKSVTTERSLIALAVRGRSAAWATTMMSQSTTMMHTRPRSPAKMTRSVEAAATPIIFSLRFRFAGGSPRPCTMNAPLVITLMTW